MKKLYLLLALAPTLHAMDNQSFNTFATAATTIIGTGLATSSGMHAYDNYARSETHEERSFTELKPFHSHLTTACKFDTQMRPLSKVALESLVRSAGLLGIGCMLRSLGGGTRPLDTTAFILMGTVSAFINYWFTQTKKLSCNGETLKKINNLERRINDLKVEIMRFANIIATNKASTSVYTSYTPGQMDQSDINKQIGALSNYNLDTLVAQQTKLIAEKEALEKELKTLLAIDIVPVL